MGMFLTTRQGKSPSNKLCQTINATSIIRGHHDKTTTLCIGARQPIKMSHMLGNVPKRTQTVSLCVFLLSVTACQQSSSYLDLPFSHDLVHNLVVVLVEHAFVVALLVAQDPKVLGALQLYLKFLLNDGKRMIQYLKLQRQKRRDVH